MVVIKYCQSYWKWTRISINTFLLCINRWPHPRPKTIDHSPQTSETANQIRRACSMKQTETKSIDCMTNSHAHIWEFNRNSNFIAEYSQLLQLDSNLIGKDMELAWLKRTSRRSFISFLLPCNAAQFIVEPS